MRESIRVKERREKKNKVAKIVTNEEERMIKDAKVTIMNWSGRKMKGKKWKEKMIGKSKLIIKPTFLYHDSH